MAKSNFYKVILKLRNTHRDAYGPRFDVFWLEFITGAGGPVGSARLFWVGSSTVYFKVAPLALLVINSFKQ